jgi:hypothetical protein
MLHQLKHVFKGLLKGILYLGAHAKGGRREGRCK